MKDKIPLSVNTRNARVLVMEERNKNVYGSVTNSVGKLQFVEQLGRGKSRCLKRKLTGGDAARVGICLSRLDALTSKYNKYFIGKLGPRAPTYQCRREPRRPQLA